jgi:hypothetical protein
MFIEGSDLKRRSGATISDVYTHAEFWAKVGSSAAYKASEGNYLTSKDEKGFIGFDHPNYHARVKKGELMAHTPFDTISWKGSSTGAIDLYFYSGADIHWWTLGNRSSNKTWIPSEEEVAEYAPFPYDMYVQDAAAAIYSEGHDTLTFLAELASVRRMFLGVAKGLLKCTDPRVIKEWVYPMNLKFWKSKASAWLEGRYGWRTLVYDIDSLNKAIVNVMTKNEPKRYAKRKGDTYSFSVPKVTYGDFSPIAQYQYTTTDKVTVGILGSVTADVHIPQFQVNPLMTGWELIPYSFVLDWFFSVGKALAAFSFLTLQYNYTSSKGFRVDVERTFDQRLVNYQSAYRSGYFMQQASCKAVRKYRTPCQVPLTPHFKLRLNQFKILDLLGMVVQKFRR